MKRILSIVSVVLALVFCLTALPVSAAPVATASIGTVTAARGQTVTVPVSITQVSGIGAIALHTYYDGNVLECVSAEAVGIMDQMDMNTANTEPVNRPNQVWLTGMGLKGMSGSGELMLITFKVKDNAPAGMTVIGFTEDGQELISGSPIEALEMALTDGGIVVTEGEAPPTTSFPLQSDVVTTAVPTAVSTTKAPDVHTVPTQAPTTAGNNTPATTAGGAEQPTDSGNVAPTTAPTTGGNAAPTDSGNEAPAQTDALATEATTVPTGVVLTQEDGTQITDQQGQPVTRDAIGISMNSVTAKPGDTVTINVSMSPVTDLTMFGISINYDKEALEYVSGESRGFFADMSFVDFENADGVVTIGGTNPQPVSGEGVFAALTFKVTKKATSGAHVLTVDPASMLMADTVDLPFVGFDGAVTVEGGAAAGSNATLYIVGAVIAVIAVIALVLFARKKKTAKPKAAKPVAPKKEKPVLPTDISEEDGFDVDGE